MRETLQAPDALVSLHPSASRMERVVQSAHWHRPLAANGSLVVFCVLASSLTLLASTPILYPYPGIDSSVFLYVGQQILAGHLPYRDVWDQKMPGIFYIDALALWMTHGSLWGIWLLEVVAQSAAGLLCVFSVRRLAGLVPALCAMLVWMLTLAALLLGGEGDANLTEAFAVPLQFAALSLFGRCFDSKGAWVGWFLIGATAALAFLLRQNLIGMWKLSPLVRRSTLASSSRLGMAILSCKARRWYPLWRSYV